MIQIKPKLWNQCRLYETRFISLFQFSAIDGMLLYTFKGSAISVTGFHQNNQIFYSDSQINKFQLLLKKFVLLTSVRPDSEFEPTYIRF